METSLHIEAVRALLKEPFMREIMEADFPREILHIAADIDDKTPDWIIAGLNCQKDEDILPTCIHSFLLDWHPEV